MTYPDVKTPFGAWLKRNVHPHQKPGYAAVSVSLKKTGVPPGDVTSDQMERIAELADHYSFGELRVTHEQNLVFADVRRPSCTACGRSCAPSASPRRTSAC